MSSTVEIVILVLVLPCAERDWLIDLLSQMNEFYSRIVILVLVLPCAEREIDWFTLSDEWVLQ